MHLHLKEGNSYLMRMLCADWESATDRWPIEASVESQLIEAFQGLERGGHVCHPLEHAVWGFKPGCSPLCLLSILFRRSFPPLLSSVYCTMSSLSLASALVLAIGAAQIENYYAKGRASVASELVCWMLIAAFRRFGLHPSVEGLRRAVTVNASSTRLLWTAATSITVAAVFSTVGDFGWLIVSLRARLLRSVDLTIPSRSQQSRPALSFSETRLSSPLYHFPLHKSFALQFFRHAWALSSL